jgi:nucleolar protein 14
MVSDDKFFHQLFSPCMHFYDRFTKAKHKVLNRPLQTESGKPGISRAIGIKKRKETLLQEYKLKNKTNVFVDKRIGEKAKKSR